MTILRTDKIAGLESVNAITGSVNFPNDGATGTGDYLRVDRKDNSDYNLSTNDFTIEFWFNSRNVGSTLHALTFAASTVSSSADVGFYLRFNGGVINAYCFQSTNTIGGVSTGSVSMNTWYHVAYVRNGSTFTVYLDGTAAASASSTATVNYDAGWNLNIGSAYTNTYHYNGYLSNVRIVNGKALYTSNFTAPTRQLEVTPETVLLCCHSSQDPTQEATGKTLTSIRTDNFSGPLVSSFIPDVGNDHTHGTVLEGNVEFPSLNYMTLPRGTTTQSNRGRGLFMGGYAPSQYRTMIDFVNIQSLGNAQHFGELSSTSVGEGADCASSTRAIQGGGSLVNTMEYVTIATTSNTTNFGDLTVARRSLGSLSSETRGIWAGGTTNPAMSDVIDYVTIATTGDAADFGNLTVGRRNMGTAASPTRGVWAGGNPGSSPLLDDTIDYITIASTGDATDFGNLSAAFREMAGCSNGTRGIFAGGGPGSSVLNTIEFITIASTGNTSDFGDLFYAAGNLGGTSNGTRGVFGGGAGAAYVNTIQFITIATTGNAADFGDLTFARNTYSATSDSHGGLT